MPWGRIFLLFPGMPVVLLYEKQNPWVVNQDEPPPFDGEGSLAPAALESCGLRIPMLPNCSITFINTVWGPLPAVSEVEVDGAADVLVRVDPPRSRAVLTEHSTPGGVPAFFTVSGNAVQRFSMWLLILVKNSGESFFKTSGDADCNADRIASNVFVALESSAPSLKRPFTRVSMPRHREFNASSF